MIQGWRVELQIRLAGFDSLGLCSKAATFGHRVDVAVAVYRPSQPQDAVHPGWPVAANDGEVSSTLTGVSRPYGYYGLTEGKVLVTPLPDSDQVKWPAPPRLGIGRPREL